MPEVFEGHLGEGQLRRRKVLPTIFYRKADGVRISVRVDDPLCTGPRQALLELFDYLGEHIKVKRMEFVEKDTIITYLGMHYRRTEAGFVEQVMPGYIKRMAIVAGVLNSKSVPTPGVKQKKHLTASDEKLLDAEQHSIFRSIVGMAQWIVRVRVDILYSVKELSRRLASPRTCDFIAAKRVVKYLLHTRESSVMLAPTGRAEAIATPYSAAPTATGPAAIVTRKSTSGCMIWLHGAIVTALCRTQTVVAMSSCEAEYYATSLAMIEARFVKALMYDWGIELVHREHGADSSSSIVHSSRLGLGGLRHMDVKFLWAQQEVTSGALKIVKIRGTEHPTDLATKFLCEEAVKMCAAKAGLFLKIAAWVAGVTHAAATSTPEDSLEASPGGSVSHDSPASTSKMFMAFATLACIGAVLLCKELMGLLVSRGLVVMRDVATQTESPAQEVGTRCPGGPVSHDSPAREQQHYEGCYRAHTVKRLREILRERGCHVSGVRFDLVQRLLRNDDHMRDSAFRAT